MARSPDLEIPTELQALFRIRVNAAARKAFEALPPSHRREYVEWIASAKKDETRERRAASTIERLTK
jgi:uncharacterized protein YdeI (YjbR/CyaY-like superfamily)